MPTHQLFRAIGTIALAFGLVFPTQAQDFDPIGDEPLYPWEMQLAQQPTVVVSDDFDPIGDEPLYPWENVAEPTLAELDNDVDTAS